MVLFQELIFGRKLLVFPRELRLLDQQFLVVHGELALVHLGELLLVDVRELLLFLRELGVVL